jgi:uncharacterized sulfatase
MEVVNMAGFGNTIDRRGFLRVTAGAAMMLPGLSFGAGAKNEVKRPNILWVSCEDTSPDLGCYGDKYAVTPNIDKLAAQGVRYENCFTHAGVCAPSRSGLITGMYPTTIGTHQMRCSGVPPANVKCFPEYLRAEGYYCTNDSKTDYQFDPPFTAWDESSGKAHWRNRAPGQPFFAVFNFTISHESQVRNHSKGMLDRIEKLGAQKHDPDKATLPPYYPDTPVVRRDMAQYYDVVTLMDQQVGDTLKQLEEDGLAEDTIVWFWGDHGRGLPRHKRWIYDSGIRVPLVVKVPEKWRKLAMPKNPDGPTGQALKPGAANDDLVAFIDFAPTMLSLAGVKIPGHIQGRAFLGAQKAEPREYIFAARDRMDEAYDLIRAVRDKRYKYIRNYMWHITRGQDINYMNEMPTMQEMRRLNAEGKLKGPQLQYFEPTKPVEELYDTKTDPHEVNNLVGKSKYKKVLERMREVHAKWARETGDIGLMPEPEFDEIKQPGGQVRKTAEPVFWTPNWPIKAGAEKTSRVTISCPTPGASIAYRIDDEGKSKGGWMLYAKSVWLREGQTLHARACRIGFNDSGEAMFKVGDNTPAKQPQTPDADPEHWRNKVAGEMLERLREIKALDGQGEKAIPQYSQALGDKHASVRYWAVIGLHTGCTSANDKELGVSALEKMLKDPAAVVRVAAAHALCDWGREKDALPILIEGLSATDKTDKARLYAVIALNKIGEKARPALPQIQAALKDSDNYVQRVAQTTLNRLENK